MNRLLKALAILISVMVSSTLVAQDVNDVNEAVSSKVEELANRTLERYIGKENFQIDVTAKINEAKLPKLPLNPGASREQVIRSLSPSNLMATLEMVKLNVILDASIDSKFQARIKEILIRKLFLNPSRGDQVSFTKLDLPTPLAQLREDLSRTDLDLRDVKLRLETAQKEKTLAEKSLAEVKSENDRKKDVEKPSANQKEIDPSQSRLGEWAPVYLPLAVMITGLLAIFGLLITFTRSSSKYSASMQAIAQAIPLLGEKIAMSHAASNPPSASLASPTAIPARPESSATSDTSAEIKNRLMELNVEVSAHYDAATRVYILEFLSRLLKISEDAGRAIMIMEFLGKDKANELFRMMDVSNQTKIMSFMQLQKTEPRKYETTLRLVEELKTFLILNGIKYSQKDRDQDLVLQILQLDESDRGQLIELLSEPAVGRFLSYLPQRDVSALLKTLDNTSRMLLINALAQLPEYAEAKQEDAQILAAIKRVVAQNDHKLAPYFDYYKDLIENSEENLGREIHSKLKDPALRDYLAQNIITFTVLFEIESRSLEEIMNTLSLKDCAVLFTFLDRSQIEQVSSAFTERKKDMIEQERTYLQDTNKDVLEQKFLSIKSSIVTDMRARNQKGQLHRNAATPSLRRVS